MNVFYKIECLTNLHVGSGDINYNIIDKEVETDPITKYPMIHASGIKGALRQYMENDKDMSGSVAEIFGARGEGEHSNAGSHKFLDARFLARPMRLSGNTQKPYILVTSIQAINDYLYLLDAFGIKTPADIKSIAEPDFGDNEFLVCSKDTDIYVEDEKTEALKDDAIKAVIKNILGDNFAIAKQIENYELPVVARNCLDDNNRNLWYEQIVPYKSLFYFAIISPEDKKLTFNNIVHIGGNESVGCGYCKITEIVEQGAAK